MAKIRKQASVENGIMQVLKILSDEEIYSAIKKTSSYLRKCSNPDLQQQIDHMDSIKLDLACMKKNKKQAKNKNKKNKKPPAKKKISWEEYKKMQN